jgi:cytochrome c oxidase subunit III
MAGSKSHDYHILPPSIHPFIMSMSCLLAFGGAVMWMHADKYAGGMWVCLMGAAGILYTFYAWWADVIKEAHAGDHTPVVQLHLRYGMILFIASEVMFFVGWFWSFFDFALFPAALDVVKDPATHSFAVENIIGKEGAAAASVFPAKGVEVIDPWGFPLLNTLILLCSGTTVTWAHHALINNERGGAMKGAWGIIGVGENDSLKKGLWLTIALGAVFSAVQIYEYAHSPFPFAGLNYSSAFYMATGFHGFHVFVGTVFLIVCLVRAYKGHFTRKQHFGFEAAAWYWHFVDVVWLFLFAAIYVWGSWGAPIHG